MASTPHKKIFGQPQIIFILAALGVFVWHRVPLDALAVLLKPSTPVVPVVVPVEPQALTPALRAVAQIARQMERSDAQTLGEFYAGLSRSIAGDPAKEPVLPDTAALRRAHRAGLLFVWRGVAGNPPNKYPGLSDALEGALTESIGMADVPLNPAMRQASTELFQKVSSICLAARP